MPRRANTIALARESDLIIGAVLIPGAAAPKLISKAQLKELKPGAALVDVAIDQGGCFETSPGDHPSGPDLRGGRDHALLRGQHAGCRGAHFDPGAGQCDHALHAGTGQQGLEEGCADDKHLLNGLNVHAGKLTYAAVGDALGLPTISGADALKG